MENIRQAIDRARAGRSSSKSQILENLGLPQRRIDTSAVAQDAPGRRLEEIQVSSNFLLSKRIVAHNGADQRSRPYDMLRTQILQSMGVKGWKVLGVTSPTPGCGKSLTACNLAFSISRQPDQSVALVDLDLQKPQIANYLGLTSQGGGALELLSERATLRNATMTVRAGNQRIAVLPTAATKESSELMSSRLMSNLLQDLRDNYQIIVLDLPPILSSDDVISVLPQIDCILLVAAVGHSKTSDVEESMKYLHTSALLRVVVNKAADANVNFYY